MGKTRKREPIKKEKGSKRKSFDRKERRELKKIEIKEYI